MLSLLILLVSPFTKVTVGEKFILLSTSIDEIKGPTSLTAVNASRTLVTCNFEVFSSSSSFYSSFLSLSSLDQYWQSRYWYFRRNFILSYFNVFNERDRYCYTNVSTSCYCRFVIIFKLIIKWMSVIRKLSHWKIVRIFSIPVLRSVR